MADISYEITTNGTEVKVTDIALIRALYDAGDSVTIRILKPFDPSNSLTSLAEVILSMPISPPVVERESAIVVFDKEILNFDKVNAEDYAHDLFRALEMFGFYNISVAQDANDKEEARKWVTAVRDHLLRLSALALKMRKSRVMNGGSKKGFDGSEKYWSDTSLVPTELIADTWDANLPGEDKKEKKKLQYGVVDHYADYELHKKIASKTGLNNIWEVSVMYKGVDNKIPVGLTVTFLQVPGDSNEEISELQKNGIMNVVGDGTRVVYMYVTLKQALDLTLWMNAFHYYTPSRWEIKQYESGGSAKMEIWDDTKSPYTLSIRYEVAVSRRRDDGIIPVKLTLVFKGSTSDKTQVLEDVYIQGLAKALLGPIKESITNGINYIFSKRSITGYPLEFELEYSSGFDDKKKKKSSKK
jgi:hypothetical protein